jgi:hypothetical protein
MTDCAIARPAPLRCPTRAEIMAALLALLPKGRAWQSSEGGPVSGVALGFDPGGYLEGGFQTSIRRPSVLYAFWSAIAEVLTFVNQRLCDLRLEFWCATHKETHDLWMREYGLPDACDPFPDLCTKVAAIGGTRCEYYAAIAARAGWSISCIDSFGTCGVKIGAPASKAGRARPGRRSQAIMKILVDLKNSPAFTGSAHTLPRAGRFKVGRRLACGPNLTALECILGRVVHAEIQIEYEGY